MSWCFKKKNKQRRTVKDEPKRDPRRTVQIEQLKKPIKGLILLNIGQSHRKVVLELKRKNIQGKNTLVQRIIKELNLKPFKLIKAQ